MTFKWQTEDQSEEGWERVEPSPPRRPRRWLLLIAAAGFLIVAAFLGWREVQRRVDETAVAVEEQVLVSHEVGLRAAREEDEEILLTILSGRDPQWTLAQERLLGEGLLYHGSPRALGLTPVGESRVSDLTLDPELREAVLVTRHGYQVRSADGLTETFTLRQTQVYRKGSQHWLLSPPEEAFWGDRDVISRTRILLSFPARDAVAARNLAGRLETSLRRLCGGALDLECPPGYQLHVDLSADPRALLEVQPERVLSAGRQITLPTPSLIGEPVDVAGETALQLAYARAAVSAAITDLVGWDCCQHARFYQGLLHFQLAALDLLANPLQQPASAWHEALGMIPSGSGLGAALRDRWREDKLLPLHASLDIALYTFLSWLGETTDQSPADLQQSLATDQSFVSWWRILTPEESDIDLQRLGAELGPLMREILEEVYQPGALPPGLDLPEEDLLLACGGEKLDLYRYDLDGARQERVLALGAEFPLLTALPGRDEFFITYQSAENEGRTLRWRPGREPLIVDSGTFSEDGLLFPVGPVNASGSQMFAWWLNENQSYRLLALDSCDAEDCPVEPIPGFPVWPPSGDRLLAAPFDMPGELLYREDSGAPWRKVAEGVTELPVWLDERRFAYILGDRILVQAASRTPDVLFEIEQFRALLSGAAELDAGSRNLALRYLLKHPSDPDVLLVIARDNAQEESFLFQAAAPGAGGDRLALLATLAGNVISEGFTPGLAGSAAPDGSWLALYSTNETFLSGALSLYDLNKGEMLPSVSLPIDSIRTSNEKWSADSAWLAFPLSNGIIYLIAPGYKVDGQPYARLAFTEYDVCAALSWLAEAER